MPSRVTPFMVEKFVCLDLPGFGKGAAGQEEGGGCSSNTKSMVIEPEGDSDEERTDNFNYLKTELKNALAQAKRTAKKKGKPRQKGTKVS